MLVDYHTHTYLCKHAKGEALDYLARAEELGLDEFGISCHCPWPEGFDPQCRMFTEEYSTYKQIVDTVRKNAAKVKIRYGIEIDWVPGRMNEIFRNLAGEDLDYIIGSIHYIGDFPFDSPDTIGEWKREGTADWVWSKYVDELYEFVSYGRFDIIGHSDLPKKFGFHPSEPVKKYCLKKFDQIFAKAVENGIALEINTCGLRKPAEEIYPSLEILKLAAKNNMMLTLGSDAHAPSEVGADFDKAVELAKEAGFIQITSFEKRKPTQHPIG